MSGFFRQNRPSILRQNSPAATINLAEDYEKKDECWDKLQEIMEAYKKEGKSVYTPTFIEDNEDKVKALQKQYEFTYTIEER